MMGVRWPASADQTRLLGHQFNVVAVANPARRRQRERALIYRSDSPPLSALIRTREPRTGFLRHGLMSCSFGHKNRQPRAESLLDALGIGRGQSIFGAKNSMSPICSVLGRVK